MADPLVRNLATVGGNLAHGDPANDHPGDHARPAARRWWRPAAGASAAFPIAGFFTGPFTTALAPDEILTEIRIPAPPARSGGAYLKLERKVGDFATAAVAVQLSLGADGTCERAASGSPTSGPSRSGPSAPRPPCAAGGWTTRPSARRPSWPRAAAQPVADLRGSAEYKKDLVRVLTSRALRKAVERARTAGAEAMRVEVEINGEPRAADVEARLLLVHLIREEFRLTGTHIGCDTSHCGACTVLLDGRPVKSCTVFAVQAHGRQIRTVEGLEQDGALHPLQEGFIHEHGLQCGYCTPGMLMTGVAFLAEEPDARPRTRFAGRSPATCAAVPDT